MVESSLCTPTWAHTGANGKCGETGCQLTVSFQFPTIRKSINPGPSAYRPAEQIGSTLRGRSWRAGEPIIYMGMTSNFREHGETIVIICFHGNIKGFCGVLKIKRLSMDGTNGNFQEAPAWDCARECMLIFHEYRSRKPPNLGREPNTGGDLITIYGSKLILHDSGWVAG